MVNPSIHHHQLLTRLSPEISRSALNEFTGQMLSLQFTREEALNRPLCTLQRWRHREATDPRDKVYALMGLFQDGHLPSINCDYALSTVAVFKRLTLDLLHLEGTLLPLVGLRGEPHATRGLPTWALDMVRPPQLVNSGCKFWEHMDRFYQFHADNDMSLEMETLDDDSILALKGLPIDTILLVDEGIAVDERTILPDGDFIDVVKRRQRISRDQFEEPSYKAAMHDSWDDALWRTMLGDLITENERVKRKAVASDRELFQAFVNNGDWNEVTESLKSMILNQAFFITQRGYFDISNSAFIVNMLPSRLAASFRRAGRKTHLYRPTPQLIGPNSSQPFQNLMRSSFSTHQARLREQAKGHDDKSPGNPEFPRISFADLGMSRNVKAVVLGESYETVNAASSRKALDIPPLQILFRSTAATRPASVRGCRVENVMGFFATLAGYAAPMFLIMSPIVTYTDQAMSMYRLKSSAGFSLDIPLIMLVASICRVFYFPGARYDTALLIQSFCNILVQLVLLKVALDYRPSSMSRGDDAAIPFAGVQDGLSGVRRPYNFWRWRSPKPYWHFLLYLSVVLTVFELILSPYESLYSKYSDLIGYIGLSVEATLPLPQLVANARSRSCKGFRFSVLAMWLLGDAMKMYWFFTSTTEIPWSFKLCGMFQAFCDAMLGVQYLWSGDAYREPDPIR
ncbi:hypothetical protein DL765_007144 [Monosporascus sp. GIB2]|nr:hypothetical protein DL765_007144 [Monosporascus sp. GIB2]